MVKHLKITVEGKIYDVVVEDVTEDAGSTLYQPPGARRRRARQPLRRHRLRPPQPQRRRAPTTRSRRSPA